MFERYVNQCVISPSYALLERAYRDYAARNDPEPCKKLVKKKDSWCAVRMSIALYRAGLDFKGFPDQSRVHPGDGKCDCGGVPHVVGGTELADYLGTVLGAPQRFRPAPRSSGCADAYSQVKDRKGIIYFNNCFRRHDSEVQGGDHIDLFDGTDYFNQVLGISAAGDETSGGDLFGRADAVRFWKLS